MQSEDSKGEKNSESSWLNWLFASLTVATVLFLYRTVQSAGWLDKFNPQSPDLVLGIAFLTGLVASLSSCLVVVGGMVIAFSEKYKSEGGNFFESAVRPNLFFHAGRITAFFLLGGLLGVIGGTVNISGNFVSVYTVIIAVVMGWLGLNILGILPSISALGLRPPKTLTRYWARIEKSEHKAAPFLLGGLTFFLPCGFTQSMQILALASGNFWAGSMSLLVFSLGTAPVLLALGIGASWGKYKKFHVFQKAAGILILIFAFFTLKSALALNGVKTSVISSNVDKEQVSENENSGSSSNQAEQIVEMSVTSRGFEPSILKIKKGIPVKWVIKGKEVSGCTNKIVVPSLGIAKNINRGENTISFAPTDAREIPFSCGMGMVRGKFIVE